MVIPPEPLGRSLNMTGIFLLYLLGNNEGFRYFLDGSSVGQLPYILGDRDLPAMTCGMGIVRHDYTPAKQDIVKRGNNQATLASTWE